jgi:hypothetical protein
MSRSSRTREPGARRKAIRQNAAEPVRGHLACCAATVRTRVHSLRQRRPDPRRSRGPQLSATSPSLCCWTSLTAGRCGWKRRSGRSRSPPVPSA